MALIIDPDFLSQGLSNTVSSVSMTAAVGNVVTFANTTDADILPPIAAGEWFEIRGASNANNNGIYEETGGSPSTTSIVATKRAGAQGNTGTLTDTIEFLGSTGVDQEKSVYYDTYSQNIWLLTQGNLSDDGATLQAIYSFTKEEWKNDSELIKFDFPWTGITPEQFELGDGWRFYDQTITTNNVSNRLSRSLVRTGGWSEIGNWFGAAGVLLQQYSGIITLGTFEASTDFAHFQQGNDPTDTTAAEDFVFSDAVNEAVLVYDLNVSNVGGLTVGITATNTITRSSGNWLDDGYNVGGRISIITANTPGNVLSALTIGSISGSVLTVTGTPLTNEAEDSQFSSAADNRNALNIFLRANTAPAATSQSKAFDASDIAAIGVSTLSNQVYRFPLTNSLDSKITINDDTLGGNPYANVHIRYFDGIFNYEVDDSTGGNEREFGIVVDAGTFSGIDGDFGGDSNTITTVNGGVPHYFDGGTIVINEGTNKGSYTIDGVTDTTIGVEGTPWTGSETDISFYLRLPSPLTRFNSNFDKMLILMMLPIQLLLLVLQLMSF